MLLPVHSRHFKCYLYKQNILLTRENVVEYTVFILTRDSSIKLLEFDALRQISRTTFTNMVEVRLGHPWILN